MIPPFTLVLGYKRTDKEVQEMMELLSIQKTKEWDEIKKDPEAVAYYESAFKEMSMRLISSVYAAQKRFVNSVGKEFLVMHPADFAMQTSLLLKIHLKGAVVGTNIDDNMDNVNRLFKENDPYGRYIFDGEDFTDMSSLVGNAGWKAENNGVVLSHVIEERFDTEDAGLSDMSQEELEKTLFGRTGIKAEAEELYNKKVSELEKKAENDPSSKEELDLLRSLRPSTYWLIQHPEVFTKKTFLAKTPEGEFIFGGEYEYNGRSVFNVNVTIQNPHTAPSQKMIFD